MSIPYTTINGIDEQAAKQQALANCTTFAQSYGYLGQALASDLRIEPVEGGFIVTGTFPAIGFKRYVAGSVPALVKLLRSWSAQYQAAPKKKDA